MSVITTRESVPQILRGPAVPVRRTPQGAAEAGISGRDVLRVLRKRKWLILLSLVLFVGLTLAGTLVWRLYWPLYTSAATLKVQPQEGRVLTPEQVVYPTDWLASLASESVSLTLSESVLQAAVGTDRIRNTTWFRNSPDDAIDRLLEELSVSARPNTSLITLSLTGSRKEELPEIVNAVAEAAQARSREMAGRGMQDKIRQLRTERDDLRVQLDRVLAEKANLVDRAEIPGMLDRTNVLNTKLLALAPQVTAMELEMAQADGSLELLRRQIQTNEVLSLPGVLQALDFDPSLRALRTGLLSLRAEADNIRRKFGPLHRATANLEARIKSLDDEVRRRETDLSLAQVKSMLANGEARKALTFDRLTKLREQYRFVDVSVRGLQATYSAYQQLEDQEKNRSEEITRIDGRLLELRLASRGDAPLNIMQPAFTPREPSMPKWGIMIALGIVGGLLIGLGLAFLLEFVDTSIRGPSDVARRVDLPLLGMIPHQDDVEENIADFRLAFSTHPNSLITEAFRQIRTCLMFSGPATQRRTLLVTSAMPEDGRTTVALNLAASIARGGRRVLVVDANFRQPAIGKLFSNVCPEGGLSSALVGQANWRDLVREIEPNLSVMAAGPMPPNPGELLGSDPMKAMISEMVGLYDQVIFDSAPCLLLTDAPALSTLVDGVILVVRAGANTYGTVQRARELLSRIGAHILGVVLNGVRTVAGGYLRKNYEAFYDYHERARLPGK